MTSGGWTADGGRSLRTAVLAPAAAWVCAVAHVLGGGVWPGWLGVGVAATCAFATGGWLARRRRHAATLIGALAGLQWAMHHWFTLTGSACGGTPVPVTGHGGPHALDGATTLTVHCGSAAGHASAHSGVGMVAAHAAAVVVVAALVLVGEHGVARLLAWLNPLVQLPALRPLVVPAGPAARRAPAAIDARGTLDAVRTAVRRRGPPWPTPLRDLALPCPG